MFIPRTFLAATAAAVVFGVIIAPPINADDAQSVKSETVPATGSFTFTTSPGVLPAWNSANISMTAISPGSLTQLTATASQRLELPVVAKTGSANALSGGFRLTNTKTRESLNCLIPTVDTKARVLDCVTIGAGAVWETNRVFFAISEIGFRERGTNNSETTSTFRDMNFVVASTTMADYLNEQLSTTVFTTSVSIATGTLETTRMGER
jgi:hypothetical protein